MNIHYSESIVNGQCSSQRTLNPAQSLTNTRELPKIPPSMTAYDQWVCWRYEYNPTRPNKRKKRPVDPKTGMPANVSDPTTWTPFWDAHVYCQSCADIAGIGFVLTSHDPFVGIDLDHCIDSAGSIAPWAISIVQLMDSYTEISPSGYGLHIFIRGTMPPGGRKRGNIEIYDQCRYFTVTGYSLFPQQVIQERTAELIRLHEQFFPSEQSTPEHKPVDHGVIINDDRQLLNRMFASRNGAELQALFEGNWQGLLDSHSQADWRLVCALSWWTGQDVARIDRIFRQSGLMRPKWDQRHSGEGLTYGGLTISKAVAGTKQSYRGGRA